jgi:hypothetical protein
VNRICWIVLGAALIGPGCLNLPGLHKDPPAPPPPPTAAAAPPPPIVLPEQVTEKNAQEMARALRSEMDHDVAATPADSD